MGRIKRRWLIVGLAALVVVLGSLGGAFAASSGGINGNAGPATSVSPYSVPGQPHGMAPTSQVMWAVVNSDGSVARAFPGTITASQLSGFTGAYAVHFAHDVTGCAYTATIGNAGASVALDGTIQVDARAGDANGVFLQIKDVAGNPQNDNFHLIVAC
jgi:hypothetical protein